MKKITSIIQKGLGLVLLLAAFSCEAWISVEPTDRLSEDKVFSTQKGFQQALNGVYAEMNHAGVYGGNLSAGALDVMGQYYAAGSDATYTYYHLSRYGYNYDNVKATFSNLWTKQYELINSVNVILEKCEEPNPLKDQYLKLIKGEALGLRAFFHLDLLRLFGPIMSQDPGQAAIPYMTAANQEIQSILPAQEVMDKILADLNAASALLSQADPILTQGVMARPEAGDNIDFCYRQYRLNHFAVQLLLARAHLWKGDKAAALAAAKAVIAQGSETFPFATAATALAAYPDRMFSSEVLFSLYNTNRVGLYNRLFAPALSVKNILSFAGTLDAGRVPELYDTQNDYRYKMWAAYSGSENDLILNKYADVSTSGGDTDPYCYMIPLIRLTEAYLIAAECEPDLTQATAYLNRVRLARNCPNIEAADADALQQWIAAEFRKEVLGEGQMFFYYKRLAMQNIPNGNALSGDMNISLASYVVPLPLSETDNRL